jgi:imidazoleglycerol-phosphate dehydratase
LRKAQIKRKTSETDVQVVIDLDGKGRVHVETGIPFLDHMLVQLGKHSLVDLNLTAKGDIQVDLHHTVEDVGICLGRAIRDALGDGRGIRRFAHAQVPMDESLASVSLDLGGRAFFFCQGMKSGLKAGDFPMALMEEFFKALSSNACITLHIDIIRGKDPHHMMEAAFKSFARALREAASVEGDSMDVPSTKGTLE